ncbi:MAG: hypothetical protein ACQEQC_07700 [Elusimicrobiota bacterium]
MSKKFKYPDRNKIRKELCRSSDFTEEEVEILNYNSLYNAYGRIVRYNEKGVEEKYRNKDWFKKALEE